VEARAVRPAPGHPVEDQHAVVAEREDGAAVDAPARVARVARVLAGREPDAPVVAEGQQPRLRGVEKLELPPVEHLVAPVDGDRVVARGAGEMVEPFALAAVEVGAAVDEHVGAAPPHVEVEHVDLAVAVGHVAAAEGHEGLGAPEHVVAGAGEAHRAARGRAQRRVEGLRAEEPRALLVPGARRVEPLAAGGEGEALEGRAEVGEVAGGERARERAVVVAVVGEAAVGDVLVGEEEVERALHRGAPRRAPAEPPRGQEVLLDDRPVVVVREVEVGPVGVELPRRLGVEELGGARDPAAHVGAVGDEPRAQAEPEGLRDEVVVVDGALGVREVSLGEVPRLPGVAGDERAEAARLHAEPVEDAQREEPGVEPERALLRRHPVDAARVGRRAEEGLHLRQERAEEREGGASVSAAARAMRHAWGKRAGSHDCFGSPTRATSASTRDQWAAASQRSPLAGWRCQSGGSPSA
jgi:hypothetical protein